MMADLRFDCILQIFRAQTESDVRSRGSKSYKARLTWSLGKALASKIILYFAFDGR